MATELVLVNGKWSLPLTTKFMRSQMEHEPSRSYGEEIYDIACGFPENAKVLEIGCAWGISTLAILYGAPTCTLHSVDKDDQQKASKEIKENGLEERWSFTCVDSKLWWPSQKSDEWDVIYVDGSHLYDDVHNDLFEAWRCLKPGGLLFLDDMTHKANKTGEYGVSVAAWELVKEKNIRVIETTSRLLLIRK